MIDSCLLKAKAIEVVFVNRIIVTVLVIKARCIEYLQNRPCLNRFTQFPASIKKELRTAHCALRTAHCALRTADCGLRTADCRLRTADCGLRNVECGLLAAYCGLPTAHYGLGIKDELRYETQTKLQGLGIKHGLMWMEDEKVIRSILNQSLKHKRLISRETVVRKTN